MPVNKWKPKKHKKKINQFLLLFIVSIGPPVGILAYNIAAEPPDYQFLILLQLIVAVIAAFILAADYGVWSWIIVCVNAALWPILLYGVPVALQADVTETARNAWFIQFSVMQFIKPVIISAVFGMLMKWSANIIRGDN